MLSAAPETSAAISAYKHVCSVTQKVLLHWEWDAVLCMVLLHDADCELVLLLKADVVAWGLIPGKQLLGMQCCN